MTHTSTKAEEDSHWKQPTLTQETGWTGEFTREQAQGALPNGTRIEKVNTEGGDAVADGMTGTVLGSIKAPEQPTAPSTPLPRTHRIEYLYFVEWDHLPLRAMMAFSHKVQPTASNTFRVRITKCDYYEWYPTLVGTEVAVRVDPMIRKHWVIAEGVHSGKRLYKPDCEVVKTVP